MREKEKYRRLCAVERGIPLFSRDWWLDVVCGEDHWEVLLIEKKEKIQAAMPLYIPRPKMVSMPAYTQSMGPWFAPEAEDAKYTTALTRRQAVCKEFTEQLRRYSSFLQNFNYLITDWLPFYWEGYRQSTRYTYLLNDLADSGQIWRNMSIHTRRNILKASEKHHITVKKGIPAEQFLNIHTDTLKRRNKLHSVDTATLRKLIETSRERGQGDLWGGYDEQGNLHAAVFIVWQESSAYYIAGGGDPARNASGAHSLVMWEVIQFIFGKSKIFDFEGSMIPGVERFFRGFGAIQTPYFTISRGNPSLLDRVLLKLKRFYGR